MDENHRLRMAKVNLNAFSDCDVDLNSRLSLGCSTGLTAIGFIGLFKLRENFCQCHCHMIASL